MKVLRFTMYYSYHNGVIFYHQSGYFLQLALAFPSKFQNSIIYAILNELLEFYTAVSHTNDQMNLIFFIVTSGKMNEGSPKNQTIAVLGVFRYLDLSLNRSSQNLNCYI